MGGHEIKKNYLVCFDVNPVFIINLLIYLVTEYFYNGDKKTSVMYKMSKY